MDRTDPSGPQGQQSPSSKTSNPHGPPGPNASIDEGTGNRPEAATSSSDSQHSKIPRAPNLSLPKGGGAIRSMGEKFNVNPTTGEGAASIPINVSRSRDDFQPHLTLGYSSAAGNGPFGVGWNMSAGASITRKTDKGLPRYRDDETPDVFIFTGDEDLVPLFRRNAQGEVISGSDGTPVLHEDVRDENVIRRYAPRIEGSFDRIERWTSTSNPEDVHWRSTTASNVTSIFGNSDACRIYDPAAKWRIFSWLLSETYDAKGNVVKYEYKAENSQNVPIMDSYEVSRTDQMRTANRYLKKIQYGNHSPNRDANTWAPISASVLPEDKWMFSIVLDYGEHDVDFPTPDDPSAWECRQDAFSSFRSTFDVRTYRLCKRVLVFHHFAELEVKDYLVGSTDFIYDHNQTATFLKSVVQSGYVLNEQKTAYMKKSLPPLMYEYSAFPSDEELSQLVVEKVDEESIENLPIGLDGSAYDWVDLYGEGISGVLTEQDGCWYYKRNISGAAVERESIDGTEGPDTIQVRFGATEVITLRPSVPIAGGKAHFGDVSGAGKLDVIEVDRACWGYYEHGDNGEWLAFRQFQTFPTNFSADRTVKLVDLTGDGLADILICADQVYYYYPSLAEKGYGPAEAVTQSLNENNGPTCVFSDSESTIYLADMSGDGLTDLVRIRNGDVCYWPNCGYGRFGSLVQMSNAPFFDHSDIFSRKRIRLVDIDGSGTTDIIYLGKEGVDIYLNSSGNQFMNRKRLTSFPPIDDQCVVNTVDLFGNGTPCLVWSSSLPGASRTPMWYVDITRGQKPHLLTKMVNNLGNESYIHYAPSTKFYLQDRSEGDPWVTKLPFPVHCVERLETVDKVSGNRFVQKYRYHHGYFDGVEREFRGFAMVEQWDTEGFAMSTKTDGATNVDASWHVPPVHVKSWFHTGAYIEGGEISRYLARGYFGAPKDNDKDAMDAFLATLLDDTILPVEPLETDVLRQACRALKGRPLRVETYSDDDSAKSLIPYSVQESNFTIEVFQTQIKADSHSIYQVHDRESISYLYERDLEDPRISHGITLDVDRYGNVLKSLNVAYGRLAGKSNLDGPAKQQQETSLFRYSEFDYTNSIDSATNYRLSMSAEARTYELSGLKPRADTKRLNIGDLSALDFAAILSLTEIPFEQVNDHSKGQRRLISRSRTLYRKDDFTGLMPPGNIEPMAIIGQFYEQAFTPGVLAKVYQRQFPSGPVEDLMPDPKVILGDQGAVRAGYVDLDNDGCWWKPSTTARFHTTPAASPAQELAEARRTLFTPKRFTDPWGNNSSAEYDAYCMFPIVATDAVGNVVRSEADYRVLQQKNTTDPNGNRAAVAFDAMGLVVGTTVMGKVSENLGDSFDDFAPDLSQDQIDQFLADPRGPMLQVVIGTASSRAITDMTRFWRGKGPVVTVTITRETHSKDPLPPEGFRAHINLEYSDGFGRHMQSKAPAKAGPLVDRGPVITNRWICSGSTVFNNKGKPVRQYEPFFDDTPRFKLDSVHGVSPITIYDPLGRMVAKVLPDHSFEKVVFGAWSQVHYDGNDTIDVSLSDPQDDPHIGNYFKYLPEREFLPTWYGARVGGQLGSDEREVAVKTAAHAGTPTVAYCDAMGHRILTIVNNGTFGLRNTRTIVDLDGNNTAVYDAHNRLIMKYNFDMCGTSIHNTSMDAGERWFVNDVEDQLVYAWNSRKVASRLVYDEARRHAETWIHKANGGEALVIQSIYGETSPNAEAYNLRGHAAEVRDQAGVSRSNQYDFKGNLLQGERQLAMNYKTLSDWSQVVPLQDTTYSSSTKYDAKNRTIQTTHADGSVVQNIYDETGVLHQVLVKAPAEEGSTPPDWVPFLSGVEYNSKLQNTVTNFGNGVTTKRVYDPLRFRLKRLVTSRASASGEELVQDLSYVYDPLGNISRIRDHSQQSVYFRNNRADPSSEYTYDPSYQLIQATGREHLGQAGNGLGSSSPPTAMDVGKIGLAHPGDGTAMGTYAETYTYDIVGNILSVAHQGSSGSQPGWTRRYAYGSTSLLELGQKGNRLTSTLIGNVIENYGYEGDAGIHGNMTSMPHVQSMDWDYKDQLRATSRQIVNNGTPETTYYVYDAKGHRVRKVTEGQAAAGTEPTVTKERIYVGGIEVFRRHSGGNGVSLERVTLQIVQDQKRIALVETRTQGSDNSPQRFIRYQFDNNLGSTSLELDEQARLISYEEYFPFGGTSYQASSSQTEVPKRYRYTGKERDEESGLDYSGARYYASWLGRWTASDPAGLVDGVNTYAYVHNSPINNIDPTGNWTVTSSDVLKGAGAALAVAAVAVVIGAVVVATGGGVLAVAAAAGAPAAAIATAGAIGNGIMFVAAAAGVAAGIHSSYDLGKEVVTGKDNKTGEDLKDDVRSEKLGRLLVEAPLTVVGAKLLPKGGGRLPKMFNPVKVPFPALRALATAGGPPGGVALVMGEPTVNIIKPIVAAGVAAGAPLLMSMMGGGGGGGGGSSPPPGVPPDPPKDPRVGWKDGKSPGEKRSPGMKDGTEKMVNTAIAEDKASGKNELDKFEKLEISGARHTSNSDARPHTTVDAKLAGQPDQRMHVYHDEKFNYEGHALFPPPKPPKVKNGGRNRTP